MDASAWGTAVASLGVDAGAPVFDIFDGNPITDNPNLKRTYQMNFAGTSAAAPQVAGLAACLQGLCKMMWGISFAPEQVRTMVGAHYVFGECGFGGLPPPGRAGIPGLPCALFPLYSNGDWDPTATPNHVGFYTNAVGAAESALQGQWFSGNPYIDGIEVLEGQFLYGNINSILASDGNNLVVRSVVSQPSGPGASKRGNILSGKTTDVLVTAHTTNPNIQSFSVTVDSSSSPPPPVFMIIYLYNFDLGQWWIAGVGPVLNPVIFLFPTANAPAFINENNNNEVLIRVWTVTVALGPQYTVFHDRIGFDFDPSNFAPGG